jgi:hypothetical protein
VIETNERSMVYLDGKPIGRPTRILIEAPPFGADSLLPALEQIERLTIACTVTGETMREFARLLAWINRLRTLRYQLKRKGKPGWKRNPHGGRRG